MGGIIDEINRISIRKSISILHRVFGDRNGNRINSIFDLPIIVSTILIKNRALIFLIFFSIDW